jgi:murein DD-endopeptidase MepM/ murein hydrolase activator NlpD
VALTVAAVVAVAGTAATGAVIFLPAKPQALTPERTVASSTLAAGGHASALASGLGLNELSKSHYAAKAAAASRLRRAGAGPKVAAGVKRNHHLKQKPQLAAAVYFNPLRALTGLQAQRIDMGADFAGSGPIYPIGDAIITDAMGNSSGWPGGGWITYQLTDGPAAGLVVYVAEDVQPTVSVGTKVTPTTVIATMFNGSEGIETGWAMPDSSSAESQLPVAGGISGAGPFPTKVGVNFDDLLQSLGVPAASNAGQSPFGLLPANYPVSWSGLG